MSIQFTCDACGKDFTVGDAMAGKRGKCGGCGSVMTIPMVSVAAPILYSSPAPSNVQVVMNPSPGKSANALGVAAVVIGILALLVCWIPFLNILVVPFVFLGGLLAFIGLLVAMINGKSGVGWPIAGGGLNLSAFLLMVVINVVVGGAFASSARKAAEIQEQARAKAEADMQAGAIQVPPAQPPPANPASFAASTPKTQPTPNNPIMVPASTQAEPVQLEMMVDEKWIPKPGDQAVLHREEQPSVSVMSDMFAFEEYVKYSKAGDSDGIQQMLEKGRLVKVANGTPILVVKRHINQFLAEGTHAIELRILDGEFKGRKVWVYEAFVNRMIPKPYEQTQAYKQEQEAREAEERKAREAAKAYAESPEGIAADAKAAATAKSKSLMQLAKNYEKNRNAKAALDAYRKIVAEYPDSEAAKEARGRVKAIEGK